MWQKEGTSRNHGRNASHDPFVPGVTRPNDAPWPARIVSARLLGQEYRSMRPRASL
jgi:hypothetical protein